MSCSQSKFGGAPDWVLKNWVQVAMAADVESEAGMNGNPKLQLGGVHAAVTEPEPAKGAESAQDSVHPEALFNTPGWEALQVRGILLRTIPLKVLGKELLPITSVRTAVAFTEVVPLFATKVVWLVC
jgi:hypothetical protein